jgi:hypothetical protein
MPAWHAEVVALSLRRYPGADTTEQAAEAFRDGARYDGSGLARIDLGRAAVGPLLVAGRAITREEYRQIEGLLRGHGATVLEITRHGHMVVRGG